MHFTEFVETNPYLQNIHITSSAREAAAKVLHVLKTDPAAVQANGTRGGGGTAQYDEYQDVMLRRLEAALVCVAVSP